MSLLKLLVGLILFSLLATALEASGIGEEEEEGAGYNRIRLWYPREPMREESRRFGHNHHHRSSGEDDTPHAARFRSNQPVGLKGPTMLSRARQRNLSSSRPPTFGPHNNHNKRDDGSARHQFAYMVSPLSEQILEVGGQRDGIEWSFAEPEPARQDKLEGGECQTISSMLLMARDEVDQLTGQLVRHCKGLVRVNKCEGTCASFVQPSVKSLTGLKKECSCCNEGSFRRIQVRLDECRWATDNRLITLGEDPQRSHMEVFVDEPIECKCRRCDTIF